MFVSDCPQTGLDCECDQSHSHFPLRGQGPRGSRTAAAAKYQTKLCDSILASIAKMRTTSQDEGRIKPSVRFAMPENNSDDSKYDQVTQRLQELRLIATQHGLTDLFQTLVDPWIEDAPVYRSDSKTCPCSSKLEEFNTQKASKASETSSDAVLLANTLNRVNTTLVKLVNQISIAITAAATTATRSTAADNDVPAEVFAERDQAGRGHPGTRAERETCLGHPVRARSPKARASGTSAAKQQATAHAAPATAAEDETVEPSSTNYELAELSPATQERRTKDNGAGIGDLFSEDEEELQVAPTEDLTPKGFEDLFKGKLPAEPWQHKRYSPDNRIWQAAAMRR